MKKILQIFCLVSATTLGGLAGAEDGAPEDKPAFCLESSNTYGEWAECFKKGNGLEEFERPTETFAYPWWKKALIIRPQPSYGRGYWGITRGKEGAS